MIRPLAFLDWGTLRRRGQLEAASGRSWRPERYPIGRAHDCSPLLAPVDLAAHSDAWAELRTTLCREALKVSVPLLPSRRIYAALDPSTRATSIRRSIGCQALARCWRCQCPAGVTVLGERGHVRASRRRPYRRERDRATRCPPPNVIQGSARRRQWSPLIGSGSRPRGGRPRRAELSGVSRRPPYHPTPRLGSCDALAANRPRATVLVAPPPTVLLTTRDPSSRRGSDRPNFRAHARSWSVSE